MDGCAIIDARRRESAESSRRANATAAGAVQTGLRKSRLHSGDIEQDMRKALVKSFMCDHYSKTMHWAATDQDPARYGIRGRSEYWLHRPSPTLQHRERAFLLSIAEKRENQMKSDHRTTSPAVDGPRAAATDGEAKAIKSLLVRDIKDFDQSVPAVVRHDDGTIRPTYIGVWGQDRLIGAALIQPALCVAETLIYRTGTSGVHATQIREAFAEHAAIIEGIAVVRKHRREGFGSQIKAFCDSWAADHGAELILSIPTNEGARLLNEKAGYTVVPPDGYLTIKVFDAQGQPLHIPYADQRTQDRGTSMWAYKLVGQRTQHFKIGVLTAS